MPVLCFPQRLMVSLLLALLTFTACAQPRTQTVLVIGDSLSAGYGMAAQQGWVSLLGERIQREYPGWQVINASISGDTSAGGAARIGRELERHAPKIVVIELGGNDGLRGLPLDGDHGLKRNLARMIEAAQRANAHVLLVGIEMPPNLGADYSTRFARIYPDLAGHYDTALLPFLLAPIAHDRNAFQPDNIHPTAAAQVLLLEHVWPVLKPLFGCPTSTPARACAAPLNPP